MTHIIKYCRRVLLWDCRHDWVSNPSDTYSTSLRYDFNTSVWLENFNTNSAWSSGFSSQTISVNSAHDGLETNPQAWSEDVLYTVNVGSNGSRTNLNNTPPMISGSLTNFGKSTWYLNTFNLKVNLVRTIILLERHVKYE